MNGDTPTRPQPDEPKQRFLIRPNGPGRFTVIDTNEYGHAQHNISFGPFPTMEAAQAFIANMTKGVKK